MLHSLGLDLILDGSTHERHARAPTQGGSLFQTLLFGRAIDSKRGSNRRISVGIVLVRDFVGFQQGLQLLSME